MRNSMIDLPVYDANTEVGSAWRPKYLHIVGICLGASLIITNVFAFKLVELFGFTFGAGALLFPFCLILGDIITEVYGFKRARAVILTSLLCFFFYAVISQIVVALPPSSQWNHQEAFATVFSFAPRVFLAGALAYLAGELSNSFVMSKLKTFSGGRYFFFRAVLSTIVGELLNSVVFFTIVFWGKPEFSILASVIINGTILKAAIEILVFPLTTLLVSKLKQAEGVEYFDKVRSQLPHVS